MFLCFFCKLVMYLQSDLRHHGDGWGIASRTKAHNSLQHNQWMPSKHCLQSISEKLFSGPTLTLYFLSQWRPSVLIRPKYGLVSSTFFSFLFFSAEWGQRPCHDPKTSLQMTLHPRHSADSLGLFGETLRFIEWCGCLGVRAPRRDWWRKTGERKLKSFQHTDRPPPVSEGG